MSRVSASTGGGYRFRRSVMVGFVASCVVAVSGGSVVGGAVLAAKTVIGMAPGSAWEGARSWSPGGAAVSVGGVLWGLGMVLTLLAALRAGMVPAVRAGSSLGQIQRFERVQ